MEPQNPFATLTLIVAPAVLTNASCILSLATGNRLARAVDRARELTVTLEQHAEPDSSPLVRAMTRELKAAQKRMLMLIRALRYFYIAIGSFASTALISLIGAVVSLRFGELGGVVLEITAIIFGTIAVGSLVNGAFLLARETRVAVGAMQERISQVQIKFVGLLEHFDDDLESKK